MRPCANWRPPASRNAVNLAGGVAALKKSGLLELTESEDKGQEE